MVSIVVPVYKAEKHLRDCIDSILNQTEQNIEVVLVDDGSPDGSGAICDAYAIQDIRIQVLHQPNGGVSSARNAGIEVAKGSYIVFVDSDDYVEPTYVQSLLTAAKEHPECAHIWCAFQTVTGYARENATGGLPTSCLQRLFNRSEIMNLHKMWLDASPINKLYRTDILHAQPNLRFEKGLSLGEDLLFNFAYLDALGNEAAIYVVDTPLYNYVRSGEESLDCGYRRNLAEIYQHVHNTLEDYLTRWNASQDQMQLFEDSRFYAYEKVLTNTRLAPDMSAREIRRTNVQWMKSEPFRRALHKRTCFVHPLYKIAYTLCSERLLVLLDWAYAYKHTHQHQGDTNT